MATYEYEVTRPHFAGYDWVRLSAINDHGQAVGEAHRIDDPEFDAVPIYWDGKDSITELPVPDQPNSLRPTGLSNSGIITATHAPRHRYPGAYIDSLDIVMDRAGTIIAQPFETAEAIARQSDIVSVDTHTSISPTGHILTRHVINAFAAYHHDWGDVVPRSPETREYYWHPGQEGLIERRYGLDIQSSSLPFTFSTRGLIADGSLLISGEPHAPPEGAPLSYTSYYSQLRLDGSTTPLAYAQAAAVTEDFNGAYLYSVSPGGYTAISVFERLSGPPGYVRTDYIIDDQGNAFVLSLPGANEIVATGFNTSNQAIGHFDLPDQVIPHPENPDWDFTDSFRTAPFVWDQTQGIRALNDLVDLSAFGEGWTIASVTGINISGQILAEIEGPLAFEPTIDESTGETRYYLEQPGFSVILEPVPEPGTAALLGLLAAGFASRRRPTK